MGLGSRRLLACVTIFVTLLMLVCEPVKGGLFTKEPGFRVMLTKKGLDYGMCVASYGLRPCEFLKPLPPRMCVVFGPVLKDGLEQLSLADINDVKNVKIVGAVEYWLTQ